MERKTIISKKNFDLSDKPYRIRKPTKYEGYGEGTHASIKGVYNYIINYCIEKENVRISDSELLSRIRDDNFKIELETEVANDLRRFIERLESKKQRKITQRF